MSVKMTKPSWRRLSLRGLSMMALLTFLGLLVPAGSGAQTAGARFVYEQCDSALPGGAPPTSTAFHSEKAYAPAQDCASPQGSMYVTQTGPVTEGPGWIESTVPGTPGGFVESATLTAFSTDMQPGSGNSYVAVGGWPPANAGDTPRSFFIQSAPPPCPEFLLCGEGGHGWAFNVALTCSGTCAPGGTIGVHYIAATEVDPKPPVITKTEGQLLSGGVLRGHESLGATATDTGGGISVLEVVVNGSVASGPMPGSCATVEVENPSYHGIVAYSPTPCPATLSAVWNLNAAEFPFHEGANTVQVCASDFATIGQPNSTCSAPVTVAVNNSCTESGVVGGQNLNVGLEGSTGEAITLPFEHVAVVAGQLTSGAGDPIAGATICLQASVQESGGEPDPIATVSTDASGKFSYQVPPGPNRRLLVGYRHDSFQVAKSVTVNSHAKPTLVLNKGRVGRGGKVQITGSLPGPSAAGHVVVLQASSLHGRRWLTFRKATTGPQGGFRASYRFAGTSGTTTYRMRAVVPRQAGYPYEPGHSRPKRIKVLG